MELSVENFKEVLGYQYALLKGSFKESSFEPVLDEKNFAKSPLGREVLRKLLRDDGFFEGSKDSGSVVKDDPSVEVISRLKHSVAHPTLNDLVSFIVQSLPDNCRIPIDKARYKRLHDDLDVPFKDLDTIFVSSDTSSCEKLWDKCLSGLFYPSLGGATENSFHCFWDQVIKTPLLLFCPHLHYQRNTARFTSTDQTRPDVSGILNTIAIWRAEEKGPEAHTNPKLELMDKLVWTYDDDIPYILAYHAIDYHVTLDVIYYNNGNKLTEIDSFDLSIATERIRLFIALRNVGSILHSLVSRQIQRSVSEFVDLVRPTGVKIRAVQDFVEKEWPSTKRPEIKELVRRIQKLGPVPFTISLVTEPTWITRTHSASQTRTYLPLRPLGFVTLARTPEELLQALYCILSAVVQFHAKQFMHRDIRWDNILKYFLFTFGTYEMRQKGSWFLIDLDDIIEYPAQNYTAEHLRNNQHAPELRTADGSHTWSVDIWSIGYLIYISTSSIDLSTVPQVLTLQASMLQDDPSARPTATDVLREVTSLLRGKALPKWISEVL